MRDMEKTFGKAMATKLAQRLAELGAAASLAEMSHLPPARCHALTGKRQGQFSVDLVHPFRLLFQPDHDPLPQDAQGGLDRASVTDILIIEVADTH
jgi:proteic killer suppression protein